MNTAESNIEMVLQNAQVEVQMPTKKKDVRPGRPRRVMRNEAIGYVEEVLAQYSAKKRNIKGIEDDLIREWLVLAGYPCIKKVRPYTRSMRTERLPHLHHEGRFNTDVDEIKNLLSKPAEFFEAGSPEYESFLRQRNSGGVSTPEERKREDEILRLKFDERQLNRLEKVVTDYVVAIQPAFFRRRCGQIALIPNSTLQAKKSSHFINNHVMQLRIVREKIIKDLIIAAQMWRINND